jgi:serine protease
MMYYLFSICAASLCIAHGVRVKRPHDFGGVKVLNYHEGVTEWIVKFKKPGCSKKKVKQMCAGKCDVMGQSFAALKGNDKLKELLSRHSQDIEMMEPDVLDSAIPELNKEVGHALAEVDAARPRLWGLERVGATSRSFTGKGVHIYVADTGIRDSHQEFGGRAIAAVDFTLFGYELDCVNGWIGRLNPRCAVDRNGHGTHCAGTAAGKTFGVAPEANVYGVKVLQDSSLGLRSSILGGIDWVTSNGQRPAVLSMSIQGPWTDEMYGAVMDEAANAGVTVVVAAGNQDADACYFSPAWTPTSITVGATDQMNIRAEYSNWGSCVDIMAPGTSIWSASHHCDDCEQVMSGTSMACPHVTGAAALLLEEHPSYTKNEILVALQQASRKEFIGMLRPSDPHEFLWVGGETAPRSAPTPAPVPPPPGPPGPDYNYYNCMLCGAVVDRPRYPFICRLPNCAICPGCR